MFEIQQIRQKPVEAVRQKPRLKLLIWMNFKQNSLS